jgi:hypothetical protein
MREGRGRPPRGDGRGGSLLGGGVSHLGVRLWERDENVFGHECAVLMLELARNADKARCSQTPKILASSF